MEFGITHKHNFPLTSDPAGRGKCSCYSALKMSGHFTWCRATLLALQSKITEIFVWKRTTNGHQQCMCTFAWSLHEVSTGDCEIGPSAGQPLRDLWLVFHATLRWSENKYLTCWTFYIPIAVCISFLRRLTKKLPQKAQRATMFPLLKFHRSGSFTCFCSVCL